MLVYKVSRVGSCKTSCRLLIDDWKEYLLSIMVNVEKARVVLHCKRPTALFFHVWDAFWWISEWNLQQIPYLARTFCCFVCPFRSYMISLSRSPVYAINCKWYLISWIYTRYQGFPASHSFRASSSRLSCIHTSKLGSCSGSSWGEESCRHNGTSCFCQK